MIILSAVLITLALVSYSIGIWAERIGRYLKPWQVVTFWMGFMFDVLGTVGMHIIATKPFNIFDPHTFTGQVALWLMLIHATWATYVINKGSENLRHHFHRYSLFVWMVWLVPYFGGMYLAMTK